MEATNAVRCPSCDAHWPAKPGAHERDIRGCALIAASPVLLMLLALAFC
jgi:hypothetical protein